MFDKSHLDTFGRLFKTCYNINVKGRGAIMKNKTKVKAKEIQRNELHFAVQLTYKSVGRKDKPKFNRKKLPKVEW